MAKGGFIWLAAACLAATPAIAQDTIKVGVAIAESGYLAVVDQGGRDGIKMAVDQVNAAGGVGGKKLELIIADGKAEPQETVNAYRKVIDNGVKIMLNGSSSAGNSGGGPVAARAEVPVIIWGNLPKDAKTVKWMFTTLAPQKNDAEKRLKSLRDVAKIKKIGILTDPSPYAKQMDDLLVEMAPQYGIEVVGYETYRPDDADFSVPITKMTAAGAQAIMKVGVGPSTLAAAKSLKQLNTGSWFVANETDWVVAKGVADLLGTKFLMIVSPPSIYAELPAELPFKKHPRTVGFMKTWTAKYGDRDPTQGMLGWDAVMIATEAMKKAGTDGNKLRDAIEATQGFEGVTTTYSFSPDNHFGPSKNPYLIVQIAGDGQLKISE